jgi:hypothetical protein
MLRSSIGAVVLSGIQSVRQLWKLSFSSDICRRSKVFFNVAVFRLVVTNVWESRIAFTSRAK